MRPIDSTKTSDQTLDRQEPQAALLALLNGQMAALKTLEDATGPLERGARAMADAIRAGGNLAYVAAGRFDGYWELGLKPWDIAAGALLVTEAGGLVGDLSGGNQFLQQGHIVCGAPKVFKGLLQKIAPHVTNELRGA